VTDVTIAQDQDDGGLELPAADEQLLRELTERASTSPRGRRALDDCHVGLAGKAALGARSAAGHSGLPGSA